MLQDPPMVSFHWTPKSCDVYVAVSSKAGMHRLSNSCDFAGPKPHNWTPRSPSASSFLRLCRCFFNSLLPEVGLHWSPECRDVAWSKACSSNSLDHFQEESVFIKEWMCKLLQEIPENKQVELNVYVHMSASRHSTVNKILYVILTSSPKPIYQIQSPN